jgi:PAS domain S-box-containing protein
VRRMAGRVPYASRMALAAIATAWPAAGYGALVIWLAGDLARHGTLWIFGWPFVALLAAATAMHLAAVGGGARFGVPPLFRNLAVLDRAVDADARALDAATLRAALGAATRFPLWDAGLGVVLALGVTAACAALARAWGDGASGDVAVIVRGGLYATALHGAAGLALAEILVRPTCRTLRRAAADAGIDPYEGFALGGAWRIATLVVPIVVALLVAAEIGLSGHGTRLVYALLIALSALVAIALTTLHFIGTRNAMDELAIACRELASGRDVELVTGSTGPMFVALAREFTAAARRIGADRRDSGERYRAVFEKALDAVITIDHDDRVLEMNRAAEQIFGHRRRDVVGRKVSEVIVPPGLRAAHTAALARCVATGEATMLERRIELSAVRADGSEFPVELSLSAVEIDGLPVFTAHVRDITERRRAEAALTASKRRAEEAAEIAAALLHVAETINVHLGEPDLLGRVARLSVEALGCDWSSLWVRDPRGETFRLAATAGGRDDLVASTQHLELSADDFPIVRALRPDTLLELTDPDSQTLLPPALMRHWEAASFLAAPIARGSDVIGVLNGGYRTRTGPFSEKQRRIARGVAHATAIALENVRLIEDLQAASRLKTEFVSTMSHELRTPLHVILGSCEMARDAALPEADKAACLGRIDAAGRTLLELIESTLEVGKLEAGRDDVRVEPVALRTWWARLGRDLVALPRRHGVTFEWDAGAPDIVVHTDPRKLGIVVRNLVGNALKFTERGFVRAEVAVDPEHVVLRIADSGVGIRADDHERIFEMFRQADGSDSRRFGGTGLGLYIVRRFVEQLGGSVGVESALGRGSVFVVSLPRSGASHGVRSAA